MQNAYKIPKFQAIKMSEVSIFIRGNVRTLTDPTPIFSWEIPNNVSILECIFDFFFAERFLIHFFTGFCLCMEASFYIMIPTKFTIIKRIVSIITITSVNKIGKALAEKVYDERYEKLTVINIGRSYSEI